MDGQMIVFALSLVLAISIAFIYLVFSFKQLLRMKKSVYGVDYQELEAIRRNLPTILRVLLTRESIARYNEKIILPNAANNIVYNFRKANEIERLSVYAVAIVDEHYELLSELSKVVDQEFQNKVPVMVDIIREFIKK